MQDPKAEYALPKPNGSYAQLSADATWPASVTGGFVLPFPSGPRPRVKGPGLRV